MPPHDANTADKQQSLPGWGGFGFCSEAGCGGWKLIRSPRQAVWRLMF
jgi:hypothetical protein